MSKPIPYLLTVSLDDKIRALKDFAQYGLGWGGRKDTAQMISELPSWSLHPFHDCVILDAGWDSSIVFDKTEAINESYIRVNSVAHFVSHLRRHNLCAPTT